MYLNLFYKELIRNNFQIFKSLKKFVKDFFIFIKVEGYNRVYFSE